MKSSKTLRISSHLLFVYVKNQDGKWRMSVLVFSSALVYQMLSIVFTSLAGSGAASLHIHIPAPEYAHIRFYFRFALKTPNAG